MATTRRVISRRAVASTRPRWLRSGSSSSRSSPTACTTELAACDDFAIYVAEPVSTAAHVAFDAPDRASVDGFDEAATASGGREKGPPGVWTKYSERYYAAFAYDPEGNNVEAVFHSPEPIHDAPRRPGVP